MAAFQLGLVGLLSRRIHELDQIKLDFVLMATALALMLAVRAAPLVLLLVGLLALGMAVISPNLYSLFSKSAQAETGTVVGIQNAAISVGQFAGPFLGSVLFTRQVEAPCAIAAAVLVGTAAWAVRERHAAS